MNAPVSFEHTLTTAHREAIEHVNCWRGRCVNQFARGERLISEALLTAIPGAKLPMLLGQRVDKLAKLVEAKPKSAKAVEAFRGLGSLRNAIVHGDGSVFIDGQGRWLLQLTFVAGNALVQETVNKVDADRLLRKIQQCVQRLGTQLKANSQTPGPTGASS
jgi:hypothetical protein